MSPTFWNFSIIVVYPMTTIEMIFIILNMIALFLLLLLVGGLFVYQTFYIAKGTTTIETFENDRIDNLLDKGYIKPEKARFPFDIGTIKNASLVLGDNPFLWVFPQRPSGDGILFQVNEHYRHHPTVVWPPSEYYRYKNDPSWNGEEVDDDVDSEESSIGYDMDDYDDDMPLGMRYRHVRRGSEGYEVSFSPPKKNKRM
jgi:hypothetical protein